MMFNMNDLYQTKFRHMQTPFFEVPNYYADAIDFKIKEELAENLYSSENSICQLFANDAFTKPTFSFHHLLKYDGYKKKTAEVKQEVLEHFDSYIQKYSDKKPRINNHLNDLTGQKQSVKLHRCGVCQESFAHKSELNRHLYAHSADKVFHCSKCGKNFTTKCGFTRHGSTNCGFSTISASNDSFSTGESSVFAAVNSVNNFQNMQQNYSCAVNNCDNSKEKCSATADCAKIAKVSGFNSEKIHSSGIDINCGSYSVNSVANCSNDKQKCSVDSFAKKSGLSSHPYNSCDSSAVNSLSSCENVQKCAVGSDFIKTSDLTHLCAGNGSCFSGAGNICNNIHQKYLASENYGKKSGLSEKYETGSISCEIRNGCADEQNYSSNFVKNRVFSIKKSDNVSNCDQTSAIGNSIKKSGVNREILTDSSQRPSVANCIQEKSPEATDIAKKSGLNGQTSTNSCSFINICNSSQQKITDNCKSAKKCPAVKKHLCVLCNKTFTKKSSLNDHILTHTGQKPHACTMCSKKFTKKSDLNYHILTHTGQQLRCSVCGKNFTKKSYLNDHMYTHATEKPFRCSFCNKGYTKKSSLNDHLLLHTSDKRYYCMTCNKGFTKKSGLTYHLATHTGVKQHRCTLCSKGFTKKSGLTYHMLTHSGEKPHPCSLCTKRFTRKSDLNYHFLTHTGQTPHCPLCNKSFTKKSNLNYHMLTHTSVKPFACSFCNLTFGKKSGLNCHLLTHTGQKAHQCSVCSKYFAQKSNLNRHMEMHSGGTHFCSLCSKNFTDKSSLRRHNMVVHLSEIPVSY